MFNGKLPSAETPDGISKLKTALENCEAIIIGAGAGLSSSAGFVYSGARFEKYFGDFAREYHFSDMYSGGFYPFPSREIFWAFWSRQIYINRYMDPPKPVYSRLFDLVKGRDYFVLTTNVDHCFQKAGFDKKRLFYTQGDYGLFQCSKPCCQSTYDNEETVRKMVLSQGFEIAQDGTLYLAENAKPSLSVPSDLLPRCPNCGRPMTMNLRIDESFAEDAGWNQAAENYRAFLEAHQEKKTLFLELGTGWNTPSIIKFPFWQMTASWPGAVYACLNFGDAYAPDEILEKSICINLDIGEALGRIGKT